MTEETLVQSVVAQNVATQSTATELAVVEPTVIEQLVAEQVVNEPEQQLQPQALQQELHQASQQLQQWPILMLSVSEIGPNPFQPRQEFNDEELEELAASVREHGVLQPILVRSISAPGYARDKYPCETKVMRRGREETLTLPYHLVAGERRVRASQRAKRKFIPAIVRDDLSDAQVAELAVVENVQRANLTPIEEARGYKRLMIEFHLKEVRIAKRVGKSLQSVRDTLKLLTLPLVVQKLLLTRKLNASHGQALLKLAPFEQVCSLVAHKAVESGLTATALGENILPNARELKGKSLLIELDYKTKFDWKSVCRDCPHKAYVAAGYTSYCLKPLEWQRKQNEAIALQRDEAARVLEAARQQRGVQGGSQNQSGGENPSGNGGTNGVTNGIANLVTLDQLPYGSYRDLSHFGDDRLPAGCNGACPCRSEVCDSRDPTKVHPICLEPQRFSGLQQAEREAHQAARERQFAALWEQASELLQAQVQSGDTSLCAALALWPLFRGEHLRYGGYEKWQELALVVGGALSLELPWEELQEEEASEAQGLAVLRDHAVTELLQLMACLHLAQEAQGAVRWGQPTPLLFAVLGHEEAQQGALEGTVEGTATPIDTEEQGDIRVEEDGIEGDESENSASEEYESEEAYWGASGVQDEPDYGDSYFAEDDNDDEDKDDDKDDEDKDDRDDSIHRDAIEQKCD